jgi:drug/metabolite transporter (DMT)-like permease
MILLSPIRRYFNSHSQQTQGILLMLSACFWFSVMVVIVRIVAVDVNAFVIVFFRNVSSLICLLPWIMRLKIKNIRTKHPKLYLMRSISAILGMSTLFYGLPLLRMTDAIALTFTTPLITTCLAAFFLGERIGYHRIIGLAVGFLGVLAITRPGSEAFHFASIFILITAACWATSNIIVKKLTAVDDQRVIVCLMMLIMVPLSLPTALIFWQALTVENILWMFLLGFAANKAQFSLTYAYSKTDVSVVQPFDFSRLVFISIFAYAFFDEVLSLWTLLGASIIFGSALYLFYREKKHAKKIKNAKSLTS